jgi:hypothetical protein
MKKLLVISALALMGCNPSGNTSTTLFVTASIEAKVGSEVTLTTYEYDELARTSKETQTVNGTTVSETSDYSYTETISRIRTTYNTDGSTPRHKLETSYSFEDGIQTETLKIFLLNGEQSTLVEMYETKTSTDGQERPQGYKHTLYNGTEEDVVLEKLNYDFTYIASATPTYSWEERGSSLTTPRRMTMEYTGTTMLNYKLYAADIPVEEGEKGVLVEERTGYTSNDTTITFSILDHSTAPHIMETKYTYTYKQMTINF